MNLPPLPEPDMGHQKAPDDCEWETSYSAEAVRAYAVEAVRVVLEAVRGGHDLEAMCEAFHRVIEAHADKHSPFHQPVNADAAMALRVLRGVVALIPKD